MLGILLLQLTAVFAAIEHSTGPTGGAMQPVGLFPSPLAEPEPHEPEPYEPEPTPDEPEPTIKFAKYAGFLIPKKLGVSQSPQCVHNVCPTDECYENNPDEISPPATTSHLCEMVADSDVPGELFYEDTEIPISINDAAQHCAELDECKAFMVDRHKNVFFSKKFKGWMATDGPMQTKPVGKIAKWYPKKKETHDINKMFFTFKKVIKYKE